ncbi:MAG TPA: tRNA(His) guanylyltransferase Thg1 family protein, partial [Polyangiaceae bacterium]|nr:tRNA(His) guanylyltransferase Thg1 family protein [Polyangiaceae bacterium]
MKFTDLDRRMRVFETAHDHCVLPGVHMVARIDGRSFSHLTRVAQKFDAPYDLRFRDCMVATLVHLATATGFSVLYGYTQSDELSLLFRRDEALLGRKLRKLLSVLAGEASAK